MSDLASLEARIHALEAKMNALEGQMENVKASICLMENNVGTFGDYKNRTDEELTFIAQQITIMITTLESIVASNMNQTNMERAKALRRRLKNNLTRANNAKRVKS